ncbi:ABC transporter permease [uncultured Sphingomonas sp.]|uniref:ABC transporter permease n=1 Tax=uncultured Sphingomonas sp. TaxID=158754 RepID=UPI0025E38BB2|nr:ABC transporter permease [uncultured Sphingomonas sp.]
MNRFALLSLYRSLVRHKLYAALNIGGLAVGIAVFLILGLYVRFETSYEKWMPGYDRVYVVQTSWTLEDNPSNGTYSWTMGGLLDQMREDFPGIIGTRINGGSNAGTILTDGRATQVDAAQVDTNFFQVMPLPLVAGDAATALAQPGNAVIDEKTARAYFGNRDPIGQTLVLSMDKVRTYRVSAVFRDLPKSSDFKLSVLVPLTRDMASKNWYHWGSTSLQTYLRFDTPAAARAFEGKLTAFVDRRGKELADFGKKPSQTQQLSLLPLADLHLEPAGVNTSSARMTVATLGLVGLLTLLIAVVNYINLATARAGLRAREVAMRKVLGADRATLVRQFLGEAVLTVAIAALGGLILAELGLPLVNAAGGLSLTLPYEVVVPALALLTVVVGILAGVYPAILLSRFPAATVLASARSPGGGRAGTRIRELLVIGQFGLAIAFMIGTAVLVAQTRHIRLSDVGFQRDALIVLQSTADSAVPKDRLPSILTAIRALPQVRDVTVANAVAGGSGEDNSDNMPLPGVAGPGPSLKWVLVSPRFFETHGTRLLAGRWFDDAHGKDDAYAQDQAKGMNIVVNRRALSTLRFASPEEAVGKTIGGGRPRTIIGVIDDMRFDTPRVPLPPTYYLYYRLPEKISTSVTTIRTTADPRTALKSLEQLWQRMMPQVPYNAKTADQRLADFYEADDRATRLFGIGAGLAVLIGCVGLWGLASFNTSRRTREIGIRKTLGASSGDIVKLLVGQFLRPVLIANLVAWPLAFFAMRTWLAGFEDAIALSPLFFIGASVVAVAVAVLTVLGQSLRASRAAPAWALRHD